MKYCGIDLASKSSAICIENKKGEIEKEVEVPTDSDGFWQALKDYKELTIVLEVSPLAEWAASILEGFGFQTIIIDARRAKALIKTKKKTDVIDAQKLAKMARTGWYTEVHRKSPAARLLRTKLKARSGLIEAKKAQEARIRGLLRSHGIKVGEVSAGKFVERVRTVTKAQQPALSSVMESLLTVLVVIRKELATLTKEIKVGAKSDELCQRLMSVPGVGFLTAITFIATIDDPTRFKNGDQVAAYLGLVPSVNQSGESKQLGRITREGDSLMRMYLVEGAQTILTVSKKPSALKSWGVKLQEKKGLGKARVAVARKLSILLYRLWLTGEEYQEQGEQKSKKQRKKTA